MAQRRCSSRINRWSGLTSACSGERSKKYSGMMGKELVEGAGGGDQDRRGRFQPAPGAPCLLPRRGHGARITDQDRRAQPADVDAQLEGIGGHHGFDRALAQSLFDLPALDGKITASDNRGRRMWRFIDFGLSDLGIGD